MSSAEETEAYILDHGAHRLLKFGVLQCRLVYDHNRLHRKGKASEIRPDSDPRLVQRPVQDVDSEVP